MKDALGNDIIIGNKYGYSNNRNGIVEVTVGVVTKINNLKVTLNKVKTRTGYYGKIDSDFMQVDKARSVYGSSLFPIVPEHLMKLMLLNENL